MGETKGMGMEMKNQQQKSENTHPGQSEGVKERGASERVCSQDKSYSPQTLGFFLLFQKRERQEVNPLELLSAAS